MSHECYEADPITIHAFMCSKLKMRMCSCRATVLYVVVPPTSSA